MRRLLLRFVLCFFAAVVTSAAEVTTLLNASYDVSREFYRDYNTLFVAYWKAKTGEEVRIEQSHTGSTKQARSVIDGLPADVVTMNQPTDVVAIEKAGLISAGWEKRFPDHASPYASTIVFLVRRGNPKGIRDWGDLSRSDVSVLLPNPKLSGNGRYSYWAAWAYAHRSFGGDLEKVRAYMVQVLRNVPVLEAGGRSAATAFVQRGLGDVLLTFESETLQLKKALSAEQFEVVIPTMSILAEFPVSVIDAVVEKRGSRVLATEYLKYLWSPEAQRLAVQHFYRPNVAAVAQEVNGTFEELQLVRVPAIFGSWEKAQEDHFRDGGEFDRLWSKREEFEKGARQAR